MQFQNPKKFGIFNPSHFQKNMSLRQTPNVRTFVKGIKTPFVVFNDGSVQKSASFNSTISYILENTQLSNQPFQNTNYVVKDEKVQSVYLPIEKPKEGSMIEVWNSQVEPFLLISRNYKMYNNLYLPSGGYDLAIFPKHLVRLRFFENSWSLLIF